MSDGPIELSAESMQLQEGLRRLLHRSPQEWKRLIGEMLDEADDLELVEGAWLLSQESLAEAWDNPEDAAAYDDL